MGRSLGLPRGFACAAALAIVSSGCGSASRVPAPEPTPDPELPACAADGPAAQLPRELVGVVGLPVGTRLETTRLVGVGPLVVGGYAPGTLANVAQTFGGESAATAESPSAAERAGAYANGGYAVEWTLRDLPGCPGAVALTISVRKED